MPSHDADPQRDRSRPEDNPFIAFRRFADSQVSSLLNTVFTLPATLANFNNAHHAREQCLFGQANPQRCQELHEMEHRIAQIRSEGRELYRVGDVQAVLPMAEELMKLDREADAVRKQIVAQARGNGTQTQKERTDLVEKVGNEKGQECAWSWSWGFPHPFDADGDKLPEEMGERQLERRRRWRERRLQEQRLAEDGWEQAGAKWDGVKQRMYEEHPRIQSGEPRVWSWSFSWPPSPDAQVNHDDAADRSQTMSNARPSRQDVQEQVVREELTNDLGSIIKNHFFETMLPWPWTTRDEYSPRALEHNEQLRKTGIQWRDAFEDLIRVQRRTDLIPEEEIGQSSHLPYNDWARRFWNPDYPFQATTQQARGEYPKRVPWESEETTAEPSYEYGHDHEDQHDDPPTPKLNEGRFDGTPTTELEAYERLLGPSSPSAGSMQGQRPSVLSTLTTTERTVAPDGTITTKVVLKKRFMDGREESSETVHTQRGQEDNVQTREPWKAMQEAQYPTTNASSTQVQAANKGAKSTNGWFWSK